MRTFSLLLALAPLAAGAQTLCDSLIIERFTYAPFDDGLHIRLQSNSTQFISYPHFDVLDDQGDNIVQGQLGFFGILPGTDQLHQLEVVGNLPVSPFTGTLVLHYSGADGDGTCTYPMEQVSLCPMEGCSPFQVYAYALSGPVNAQLVWTISNADDVVLDNGELVLTASGSIDVVDTACVPPGVYDLNVQWPFPTGGTIQVGVTPSFFESDPVSTILPSNGSVSMPFTLFEPCIEIGQGLEEGSLPALTIAVDGRTVRIGTTDGRSLGTMLITDAMGRHVHTIRGGGSSVSVYLGDVAAGTYLLRSLDPSTATAAQRFILF